MSYDFGNLISDSFSLKEVPRLVVSLDNEQTQVLTSSEETFLEQYFTSLGKKARADIMDYMYDVAKNYAIVLEALFYYMRNDGDFYKGKTNEEIIKEYAKALDFIDNLKGPFDEDGEELTGNEEFITWSFEKNEKTYYIRAVVSPTELSAEDNISGKKGPNVTILDSNKKEISKDLTSISIYDVEKKFRENGL